MTINKQKGNMYPWVTHTWNPIKGKCPHDCSYCYIKRFPVGKLRLDEKCFKDNLGSGNTIFVGSSIDMFADEVPSEWISKVFDYCSKFFNNIYLFQTKNPKRFHDFSFFPAKVILGTTIETNKYYSTSEAPSRYQRMIWLGALNFNKMISIEPILDFDLDIMINWIKEIKPKFVSIGADSKGHNLPEPSPEKIKKLIKELKKFTEVKIKNNLKRLA